MLDSKDLDQVKMKITIMFIEVLYVYKHVHRYEKTMTNDILFLSVEEIFTTEKLQKWQS